MGIRDTALSQQLQLNAELTLDKAKTKVRQREAVGEQQRELKGASEGAISLEEVRFRKHFKSKRPQARPYPQKDRDVKTIKKACTHCVKESHPHDKCPAKDATCHRCNKKGHYSSQCFSKGLSEITTENPLDPAFLGTVTTDRTSAWFTTVILNGKRLSFKLDTGAEVTAISMEAYKQLRKPQLTMPEKILYGPSRQPLKTTGQFAGKFSHNGEAATQRVFVVDVLKTNLLGLPAITVLGLAIRRDTLDAASHDIRKQFSSVFQGLGNLGEEFEIYLKPDAAPHSLFSPRYVPLPLRSKVKDELERMEKLGVIAKVDQPTPWCAGMVVVLKKEGAIRICVDLKPLNENVLCEIHPLPKVDETLAQLSGATVFSKLDAISGFWQIPQRNRSCSPPSSPHSGDTAFIRCPSEYPALQNTSRKE